MIFQYPAMDKHDAQSHCKNQPFNPVRN